MSNSLIPNDIPVPTSTDFRSFDRKNKICKIRREIDRVSFTIDEVEKEIKQLNHGFLTLSSIKDYLTRYAALLEAEEEAPWFAALELLMDVLDSLRDLKDSDLRERLEASAILSFLKNVG